MISFYLKSAIGSLRNNPRFSLINITGFAFAISVCLAIALFLIHEHSHDRYHENSGRIFRLTDATANSGIIDFRVKDILLENYPQITKACLALPMNFPFSITAGANGFRIDNITSIDNDFFDLFSIEFLAQSSELPMPDINSGIITRSAAARFFGEEDPVGREIIIENIFRVTITGVIEGFPSNSSFSPELLVNAENDNFKFYQQNSFSLFQIYIQLDDKTDPFEFAGHVNANPGLLAPYGKHIEFLALKDIYLRDTAEQTFTKQGNSGLLKLLSTIALIILSLAIINYVNLTASQQVKRSKETGIRKVIGAKRTNIIYHYFIESLVVTVIAFFLGILLLKLMLPLYNFIYDIPLELSVLFRFPNFIFLVVAIFFVGILSGTGPAIILSGISPLKVFNKTAFTAGKGQIVRNCLTVFQFTVSIVLIFCIMIVMKQIRYVKYSNPGFRSEQLLKIDFPVLTSRDDPAPHFLNAELTKSPYVLSTSATHGVPGAITHFMWTNMEENPDWNIPVPTLLVDTNFLKTFDMKIIKGRGLEPGDYGKVCLMNESAWKFFGFEDLENKRFDNYGGFDIVGVVNDFHYNSLHSAIEPLFILFTPDNSIRSLNIRFDSRNTGPLLGFIDEKWREIMPGVPLQVEFYDEWFASMYREEERFARSIGLFALLAVVISCIGILGLAVFSSERRTKEIGIRKVNGAMVAEIMLLLNRDFLKWVGIAFIISIPVAWYSMQRWLENFAYRTELSWWIFALSGLMALVIALLTVSWQSWRAARRNPVEALRYE